MELYTRENCLISSKGTPGVNQARVLTLTADGRSIQSTCAVRTILKPEQIRSLMHLQAQEYVSVECVGLTIIEHVV